MAQYYTSTTEETFTDLDALSQSLDSRTNEEVMASVESEKDKAMKEKKMWSTESDGLAIVQQEDKSVTKDILKGGRNMFRGTNTPTKFKPDANNGYELKAHDFYRDGYLEEYVLPGEHADGTRDIGQRYKPAPELVSSISDDWKGALATIKLVNTTTIKKNAPGQINEGQLIPEYSKFFLESIQESHQEKVQIVETFNDFYVFFYGEKPPIYTFSGTLLNLENYNWLNEFTYYYENFWRGTKAVDLGARVILTYNYQQVQGYILSMNTNINAVTDKAAPFSFQFIVTKRIIFNQAGRDKLFVDNLLPKPVEGQVNAIDTDHGKFSTALLEDYLSGEGKVPASSVKSNAEVSEATAGNKVIKIKKAARNKMIADNKSKSAKTAKLPGKEEGMLSGPVEGVDVIDRTHAGIKRAKAVREAAKVKPAAWKATAVT